MRSFSDLNGRLKHSPCPLALIALGALVGCAGASTGAEPAAAATDAVVRMLYGEGLVRDAEVRDSMLAAASRYAGDSARREVEARRLLGWLDAWERANPARAAAARSAERVAREAAEARTRRRR